MMPFKSYRQQRYMFKFHPEIAERWAKEYGTLKKPKGYRPKKKKKRRVKKWNPYKAKWI